jgi:hypothetical protein
MLRLLACLALATTTACAQSNPPTGALDVDASYQIIEQRTDQGRIIAYVKAQPSKGRVSLCGAFLVEAPDADATALRRQIENPASSVGIAESPLQVGTRYFPRVQQKGGAATMTPPRAACVSTSMAWQDSYAGGQLSLQISSPMSAPKQLRTPSPGRQR